MKITKIEHTLYSLTASGLNWAVIDGKYVVALTTVESSAHAIVAYWHAQGSRDIRVIEVEVSE